MKRNSITPRNKWKEAVEKLGFGFHSTNVPYWDESACYEFTMEQILFIEAETARLWQMCLDAVQYVIDNKQYAEFQIPDFVIPLIEKSWNEDAPSIYGRFDFCYKDGQLKLLEFNADTPTSLYEAGVIQWYWLQDYAPEKDQFNSIHEKMRDYWKFLKEYLYSDAPLHFTCVKRSLEDLTNTEYIRDLAMQAGIDTKLVFIDDIGWNEDRNIFVDMEDKPIKNIFKLYPWETLVRENFAGNLVKDANKTLWIEPAWRMLLSNKAILPLLWKLYKGDPLILEADFKPLSSGNYVLKPILGREGSNVSLFKNGETICKTEGEYGAEGFISQALCELPNFDGNYPLIGSWIIGQEPAGMGIREANSLITGNTSRFVPHLING